MKVTRRRRRTALFSKAVAALAVPVVIVAQGAVASAQPALQKPAVPWIRAVPGAPNSGPGSSATSVTFTALLNPHGSVTSYLSLIHI